MISTQVEFARFQRGRQGPAWRVKIANSWEMDPGTRPTALYDQVLINFIKYRRLMGEDAAGAERASTAYPLIAAAERLNEDRQKTAPLMLMVLADMSYDEMQTRSGIEIPILQTWELLFFDARRQQKATCWLANQIINPERQLGDVRFASKLKLAVMAGPVAVRAMLDMEECLQLDEADRLFQRKLALTEKLDVAAEMPIVTEKHRLRLMKMHLELMSTEKRMALAERKLTQRCAEAHERYELRKMRLEQAAARAAAKLHDKRRKAEVRQRRQAEQHQAAEDEKTFQRSALQKAAACRAAESPLAQLRWSTHSPADLVAELQATLAIVGVEEMIKPLPDAGENIDLRALDEDQIEQLKECLFAVA